jgi:hypothetical protein
VEHNEFNGSHLWHAQGELSPTLFEKVGVEYFIYMKEHVNLIP